MIANLWEDYVYLNEKERRAFIEFQNPDIIIFSGNYDYFFVRPGVISIISEFIILDISSIIDEYLF